MSQLPPSCHDNPLHVTITSLMSQLPPNVTISPSCHDYPPHVTITSSYHVLMLYVLKTKWKSRLHLS